MSDQEFSGGCQCGAIRYRISGEPIIAAICHCSTCRRAHAAPAVAWAMFADGQVTFSAAQPTQYQASTEAKRGFCPSCGTQISFTASFLPNLIDISIGSLDDPEAIKPTSHIWHSKHLSWVEFTDDLPRHPEFPPQD